MSAPRSGGTGARDAVELLALIVTPASLVGVLLFYFGWARSRAQAAYFGIDADIMGRTTQEYTLRGIGSVFWPLILILAAILGAIAAHALAGRWASSQYAARIRLGGGAALVLSLGLLALAGAALRWPSLVSARPVMTPVLFALGVAAGAYGLFLLSTRPGHGLAPLPRGPLLLVTAIVVVFVFWAVGAYADARGRSLAERAAADLRWLPSVTIYSGERLHLAGPGVEERRLPGSDSAYRYHYSGLKLLAHSGNRFFLLPQDWTREDGATIVLAAADGVRLEFSPGR